MYIMYYNLFIILYLNLVIRFLFVVVYLRQ